MWRICSDNGWWSVFGKKKRGKNAKVTTPAHDDLLRRDFTAAGPNQLWLTDLPEHRTDEGELYLCAIKDVWSNRIVGYSISDRMEYKIAADALNNAVVRRSVEGREVAGCRLHSDRASHPEQIGNRLKVDFPDDESMRISHEAIYQSLYIEGRGALKRELVSCLRASRALRVPRGRSRLETWAHVTPETLISQRPPEVEDHAVPGHWEGDLLIGLERSAIGAVVDRTTKFTMLLHLPREEYRHKDTPRNGGLLHG